MSSKSRSPKKGRKSGKKAEATHIDVEEAPLALVDFDEADTAEMGSEEGSLKDHPFAVSPSETAPGRLAEDLDALSPLPRPEGGLPRPESAALGAALKVDATGNGVMREYSETPSWIELKKWRVQQEWSELTHLSLHQLARDGDAKRIKLLLDQPPSLALMRKRLEARDEEGNSPLHYATRYSHFPVIRLLVQRGADVNSRGEDQARPLHFLARFKRQSARRRSVFQRKRTRSLDELIETFEKKVEERRKRSGSKTRTNSGNNRKAGRRASLKESAPGKKAGDPEDPEQEEAEIVTFLVSHGADVNAPDGYGMTPLHHCAMRSNFGLATQLLACPNISLDGRDHQQMTPLHVAAAHGAKDIAAQLLASRADIRASDEQSNTPLHYAAQDNHLHIVRLLLDVAAGQKGGQELVQDLLADQDYESNTPLFLAVDNGNLEIVRFLLEQGADANTHRVRFDSALHAASVQGDLEIVQLLVSHGAKVDARNADQATPLHKACAYNHWAIAEFLLDQGATLQTTDSDGITPFLTTAREGHPETLKRLLQRDVDIAAMDKTERTAFCMVAEYNHVETLKALLANDKVAAAGAELRDKGDRYMSTPLHKACEHGHIAVVRLLVLSGSKVNAKNEEEKTPLHVACKEGRTRIVRCLLASEAAASTAVYADEDEDSNTPLHLAASFGHVNVCRELIEAGANIAARNAVLWTPLDCAAAHGWEDTTNLLLDYDSPVDPTDKSKTTPLHLAARQGHTGVLNLLLARGATISLTDHKERNCLDLAIEYNHKDCAFAIVRQPNWRAALANCQWAKGGYRTTPLRKLIRSMPEVAQEVFARCTEDNGLRPEDKGYSMAFDWTFIDDTYVDYRPDLPSPNDEAARSTPDSTTGFHSSYSPDTMDHVYDDSGHLLPDAAPYTRNSDMSKLSHPLMLMVRWERQQLLSHPLVRSLLRHKWNSHGRYVYYSFLMVYATLVALLTAYVVLTPPTFRYFDPEARPNESFSEACEAARANGLKQEPYVASVQYAILIFAVFHAFKELFQIYQRGMNYLSWDNVIEWAVYISAGLVSLNFSSCCRTTGLRMAWQWQVGALAVFLAWMGLVLYIQKLPRFGIYVVMFMDVLRTFSSFFIVFILFILAFGFSFFVLLQSQTPFAGVRRTMIKTAVMMIGEFEFDDIFTNNTVHYKAISYALFCLFVIIMTIIIMNLLVGLAVDDIKAVQDQALLKRLAMQVQLVLQVEQMAPERWRRRWVRRSTVLLPNQRPKLFLWRLKSALMGGRTVLSKQTISGELNREEDEMEKLNSLAASTEQRLKVLTKRFDDLNRVQERQSSMIAALLRHLEVPWEEEDQYNRRPRAASKIQPIS